MCCLTEKRLCVYVGVFLCVGVSVCVYVYMYVCVYVCLCVLVCEFLFLCGCMRAPLSFCLYVHVCVRLCPCTAVCVLGAWLFVRVCLCVFVLFLDTHTCLLALLVPLQGFCFAFWSGLKPTRWEFGSGSTLAELKPVFRLNVLVVLWVHADSAAGGPRTYQHTS